MRSRQLLQTRHSLGCLTSSLPRGGAPTRSSPPSESLRASDHTDLCDLSYMCILWSMPTDAEITFADHMGRFYARRFAFPPMVGRLIGYLAVCDPPEQTHRRAGRGAARQPQRDRGRGQGRWRRMQLVHRSRVGRRADGPRPHRSHLAAVDGNGRLRVRGDARAGAGGPRGPAATPRWSGGRCCWRCRRSPTSWSSRCRSCSRSGRRGARRSSRRATCPNSARATGGSHDRSTSSRRSSRPACASRSARRVVLDGVDLTVAEGTIFALLGPNGAGKTTIVRILSTLISADAGDAAGGRPRRASPTPTACAPRSASPASSRRWTTC